MVAHPAVPRMTVRAALALPPLRRGLPEIVAGARNLDRPIRWAHAAEVPNIAELLKGGELLLTTGMGIAPRAADQRRFAAELAERGVAAMVVELGTALDEIPPALADEAERRGLPLVALRRAVPFVEVTEAIHSELLARQLALLRRGEDIHARFTTLMLEGEGADTVVRVLADTIADPVVLEDAEGGLLFHARHRTHDADVLAAWEALRVAPDEDGAIAVDVPAADASGPGRLVALPLDSPLDDFDRIAIERAAGVIALASLRTHQQQLLALRERGGFLAELADAALGPREAADRARALGFPVAPGALLPLAIALAPAGGGARRDVEERAAALAWRDARTALERDRLAVVFGARPDHGDVLALVALHAPQERDEAAAQAAAAIHAAVGRHFGGHRRAVVVAGPAAGGWDAVAGAMRDALETVAPARALPQRPWHDAAAADLPRLLVALRGHPALDGFVRRRLERLLEHDAAHKHKLLPTLEALCAHGGQKAETARALHLGRQALYHRLARIEAVLGADLDDEDTLLGLHLALRANRLGAA